MYNDFGSLIAPVMILGPGDYTAAITANDAVIDMLGYNGLTILVGHGGDATGTGTLTPNLKHGDTDVIGSMTNVVAADDIVGDMTAYTIDSAPYKILKLVYRGSKRYVAFTAAKTGTWTANPMFVLGIKHQPNTL